MAFGRDYTQRSYDDYADRTDMDNDPFFQSKKRYKFDSMKRVVELVFYASCISRGYNHKRFVFECDNDQGIDRVLKGFKNAGNVFHRIEFRVKDLYPGGEYIRSMVHVSEYLIDLLNDMNWEQFAKMKADIEREQKRG